MAVQVYGCNHIVIEVTDAKKAVKFYADVFGLKMLRGGEGAAWCKLGEHQFMAIFEVDTLQPDRTTNMRIIQLDGVVMSIPPIIKTSATCTLSSPSSRGS